MKSYLYATLMFITCLVGFAVCQLQFQDRYLDMTSHKNHQLNQTTISLLESLSSPLKITLLSNDVELIQELHFFVHILSTYADIEIFTRSEPLPIEQQEQMGFAYEGILFELDGRQQGINLSTSVFNELTFTKALFKLKRNEEQWVAFLTSHGEPNLDQKNIHSYSSLATALEQQGFKTVALNLLSTRFIADNTSILVITNPKTDYLPFEQEQIEQYLRKGGSVLWLMDFQGKPLPWLSQWLGIQPHPGIIIDKHGSDMGTPHPAITIVSQYPAQSLYKENQLTAFPWAQALISEPKAAFQKQILFQSMPNSWTHEGAIEGSIEYAKDKGEIKGPLTLGYLLTRTAPSEIDQKIIVIGNHRFATNAAIQNYGNLALAMTTFNTLAQQSDLAQVAYDVPTDLVALVPQFYQRFINIGAAWILPIILIGFGFLVSFRRYP